MVTDPIADFLSQIRNGYLAKKPLVVVYYSKMKEQLAKILIEKGYIKSSKVKSRQLKHNKGEHTILEIELKYTDEKPAVESIKRISSPGRKIYVDAMHIPTVLSGYGIAILSTSKGLMTNKQAKKQKIGGEVICHIS
jgi:small subunit ribosomal protein S8